jgi:hypothetical protein
MKRKLIIAGSACMVLLLTSCGGNNVANNTSKVSNSTSSKNQVVADSDVMKVIDKRIKGINDDKLDEYLSVFVNPSDLYNKEKLDMQTYLKRYSVKAQITSENVINKTKTTAQVQYVVKNTRIIGAGFLNNTSLIIDNLTLINNEWKITDEDVEKIEYQDDVYNVIYDYIKALNNKDINEYIQTIDSTDLNNYNSMKDSTLDLFNEYNLAYNLEEATIETKSNSDTKVKFTYTVVKTDSSDFQNNRTTGFIHLRLVNNAWKIFKVDITKTENIN